MAGPVHAMAPDGLVLDYRVLRDGFEIGRHKVLFRHDGDAVMTVETEIRISVSFLFITLYTYRLDARETWRGDRLVRLDSTTDDDGDLYAVRAVAEGDGLRVEAGAKSWTAPATVVPSSLWRREMARGSLLIGVEQGEAIAVAFEEIGRETVTARGAEVSATKVVVSGELERQLWYDDDGILVHLRLIARDGSTITYALE
ncbi:MAG: hypothetical protein IIC08_02015 [Proteobacteria bacterium]|nr:hypothetical protein [Pseudomonadota bacterium]